MMPQKKVDHGIREKVIEETSKFLDIKLYIIEGKTYFKGSDGKNYCIICGYGDWHGLRSERLEPIRSDEDDRVLIFAKVNAETIELYSASMRYLITNKDKLSYAKESSSEYQFDLKYAEYKGQKRAYMGQLPNFALYKFHTFSY